MMSLQRLLVFLLIAVVRRSATIELLGEIPVNSGRICAVGDFNGDRLTDVVVQRDKNLTILLQVDDLIHVLDEGVFTEAGTFIVGSGVAECSLGDFNADERLDILVAIGDKNNGHDSVEHQIFLATGPPAKKVVQFLAPYKLPNLGSQAMAIDVDGDGSHDVLGFFANGSLFCRSQINQTEQGLAELDCSKFFEGFPRKFKEYAGVPHLYTDIDNDYVSDLIFMNEDTNGDLEMIVFKRRDEHIWYSLSQRIPAPSAKHIGAPVVGDFDGNSRVEIIVPVCESKECSKLLYFHTWEYEGGAKNYTITQEAAESTIVKDGDSKVVVRVGDYQRLGYPDFIVTVKGNNGKTYPRVIQNTQCDDCGSVSRKFVMRGNFNVLPPKMASGSITLSSFFDLREDGDLDILIEYELDGKRNFGFMKGDDKGDTTFLKVQLFTPCRATVCLSGEEKLKGSGISWNGGCVGILLNDAYGGRPLLSKSCQIPANTHRTLNPPYVLVGLGRSPNFVDEVYLGAPRYTTHATLRGSAQHLLKQIVPNSRVVVSPPEQDGGVWESRLYVTPSQLILQSLIVIVSVCLMLLMVAACLHYRERKEDRVERQSQSHRFHFDGM